MFIGGGEERIFTEISLRTGTAVHSTLILSQNGIQLAFSQPLFFCFSEWENAKFLFQIKEKIMEMTLKVEVNSPSAASMVLDTMSAAADPEETLSESALVSSNIFV